LKRGSAARERTARAAAAAEGLSSRYERGVVVVVAVVVKVTDSLAAPDDALHSDDWLASWLGGVGTLVVVVVVVAAPARPPCASPTHPPHPLFFEHV